MYCTLSCTPLPTEQAASVQQIHFFRGVMTPTLTPAMPGLHRQMLDFSECVIVIVIVIVKDPVPTHSVLATVQNRVWFWRTHQLTPTSTHARQCVLEFEQTRVGVLVSCVAMSRCGYVFFFQRQG